jgi:alpha-ketoglutarate-dependent taurine dioxygenase
VVSCSSESKTISPTNFKKNSSNVSENYPASPRVSNSGRELGGKDDEISVISSAQAKKIYADRFLFATEKKQSGKEGWHSDITFEPIPSDYALLRLTQLPKTGGGLWCLGAK